MVRAVEWLLRRTELPSLKVLKGDEMMWGKELVDQMGGQLDWMTQFSSNSRILFQGESP